MIEYKCKYCNKLLKNNQGLSQHQNRCLLNPYRKFTNNHVNEKIKCPYCDKLYYAYGLKNHISFIHIKDRKPNDNLKTYRENNNNFLKGKTYKEIYGNYKANLIKNKISKSLKGKPGTPKTKEQKEYLSKIAKQRHAEGWDNKAGRSKKYKFYNYFYNKIETFDGTWELNFANFLFYSNIRYLRNKNRFSYNYDGKQKFYTPDFYLKDFDCYVEIKGYKTNLDIEKWKQFSKNLIVFEKDFFLDAGLIT